MFVFVTVIGVDDEDDDSVREKELFSRIIKLSIVAFECVSS